VNRSGATTHPVVEATGVTLFYGERVALDELSIAVPRGVVFGLLGPNGSGKSTFISLLAAMERPPSGSLKVFGEAPSPRLRARVGTVFQENALDPLMSVKETLTLTGRLFGLDRSLLRERMADLLEAFGLSDRIGDSISSLSGGMRRRLEMVRALLHDPEMLLLDEPTTGIDPDERRALWDTLLNRERGSRTILLATNDLTEADGVCDEVAFLRLGQVVTGGTPDALKRGLKRESVRLSWENPSDAELATVAAWPGTGELTREGNEIQITVDDAADFVPRLFAVAPHAIRSIRIEESSLEDAYFQHVGRRQRAGLPV
jgi:ABC-2 type transport system ATP-binding protein